MNFNKRLLASIMVLTISSSILTGCSKSSSNENITTTTQTAYENLFKENEIMDVKIEIKEEDWNNILENPLDEEYHTANITIGNSTIENVGFRTKGNSSLTSVASSDSDRFSFRVKLDKYVDGQNLNGLNEFVLNNNFQDPSYMREYLAYQALEHLGVDVPETAYSNVYINGELYGFYLAVEAIDDSFVDRITDNDSNDVRLYKAEGDYSTLVDEDSLSNFELKEGEDDGMASLKELVSAVNSIKDGNKGDIESIFDVDTFLKSIAVNTVIGSYDSYNGSKAHNYYLLEESGVFKYIPWDYNMAFGTFPEDNGKGITVSIDEPLLNVDASQRPLITKLLSIDEYKEKYYGYLEQLITYYEDFETQVNDLASLIKTHVENDPTAFYTVEQFEENITASGIDLSNVSNQMNGNRPNIEENGKMPQGERPQGEMPNIPQGDANEEMPNRPGGMNLSGDVISMMDYLQQRIENIKEQLAQS